MRMPFGFKIKAPQKSYVLVVDALGFANRVQYANSRELISLVRKLEQHYHRFRTKIPFGISIITPRRVFGSSEFSTFQLNDMFALFSEKDYKDGALSYLVASSLLYQLLVMDGFIPRGGLGFGLVLKRDQCLLGSGFIDAYRAAEKRDPSTRNICAVQVSPTFLATLPPAERVYRLLCVYQRSFFLNPRYLVDPEMGQFDKDRLLHLLRSAGVNEEKLEATCNFLNEFEDYDAAMRPGSRSRELLQDMMNDLGPQDFAGLFDGESRVNKNLRDPYA
jgi:hypothetical protein